MPLYPSPQLEPAVYGYILEQDRNGATALVVENDNGGASNVSAGIGFFSGSGSADLTLYGTGVPASNFFGPGVCTLENGGDIGIATSSGGTAKFSNNGGTSERVRIGTGLMVGTTTDPGAGIINLNTGLRIANAAASNKILKGNGTNFVVSTETYAVPGTSGNAMVSDGTNWISSAPNTTFKVATGQALTSTTLVDITGLTFALVAGTYIFSATLHGQITSLTAGIQLGINYSGTYTSGDYQASGVATGTTMAQSVRGTANNTATGTFMTVATTEGWASIMGVIVAGGAGTFSIRALKVTNQTFTVRASSWCVVTKVA